VDALDEHVRGEDAQVRAHLDEGRVVARAERHSRHVLGQEPADSLDQFVLGEARHESAPFHPLRARISRPPEL
jgi:hypothetical protein